MDTMKRKEHDEVSKISNFEVTDGLVWDWYLKQNILTIFEWMMDGTEGLPSGSVVPFKSCKLIS